ncbi:MAG: hypothetical protein NVSMB63_12170 [Sediminibacterium sp.]
MPETSLSFVIAFLIAALLAFLFYLQRKNKLDEKQSNSGGNQLRLQAYERLTLLTDRIAIPNLISRLDHRGLTAKEMQLLLTRSIRDEFDYNITQQIYISPETWQAVKNLKEKNLLVINQAASILPTTASGLDLCKTLLEYLVQDNKANLHELVAEALSYEAKKLL